MHGYQNQGLTQLFENDLLCTPAAASVKPPSEATPMPDFDFFSGSTNPIFAHLSEAGESLKSHVLLSIYKNFIDEQNSKFDQFYGVDQNRAQIEHDVTELDKFLSRQETDSKGRDGQNDSITQSTDPGRRVEQCNMEIIKHQKDQK